MMYLSQLLGKTLYKNDEPFAKVIDMTINEHELEPSVTKIELKKGKRRIMIAASVAEAIGNHWQLKSNDISELPKEPNDYYLSEDLLDKQVIDVDGRRLVRVNDILLDDSDTLKVSGLDVGIGGILRRLGLGKIRVADKVLPWKLIEAFDYDTGSIRIRLKQNSLNTFHPAEIANILEDVGTKERLGIVSSLDADRAAEAIEESDEETQVSILEGLTPARLKTVLNNMHVSEIADVLHEVNPDRIGEIQQILGAEKMQKVKGLSTFSDNVAGGLMHETFFLTDQSTKIHEVEKQIHKLSNIPESILVTAEEKFVGTVQTKDLIFADSEKSISEFISNGKYLQPDDTFTDILELFSQYNLRVIPVVDTTHQPIGVVLIDEVLKIIEEENQKDDNH